MTQSERDLLLGRLDQRVQHLHEDVREIKSQTTLTNGRVGKLEEWRDKELGSKTTSQRYLNIFLTVAGIIIGALATIAAS